MRIYFGRLPEHDEIVYLDSMILSCLIAEEYKFNNAVDAMVKHLMTNWDDNDFKDVVCHTLNPLIINYFTDDFAKEYMWMIDEDGNHIKMGDDEHMMNKLDCLGVGEVMCDDYRSFT